MLFSHTVTLPNSRSVVWVKNVAHSVFPWYVLVGQVDTYSIFIVDLHYGLSE